MNQAKTPPSLRAGKAQNVAERRDFGAGGVTTVACLVALGSIGTAEAQQSPLPPVTIDAPIARPRPPAAKQSAEQKRVRAAVRRASRRPQTVQAPPAVAPSPDGAQAPDRNPYANAAAPYKADRLASPKFTRASRQYAARASPSSPRKSWRTKAPRPFAKPCAPPPGLTLGTGEGGNAFGDRFFIRGFDARNDVFIDGIRDPAVSIRENFFTEQIEILRGPASSFAGRGTAGGAVNIVTKQAGDRDFVTR